MIKRNFPEDEVEAIRQSLLYDGWRSDPLLPKNWVYKNKKQPTYCNEEGELLISHGVAINFIQEAEKYSTEDVNNLIKFIDKTGGRLPFKSEMKPFAGNEFKPFDSTSSLKRILKNAVNTDELMKTLEGMGWKEHLYLPSGWLYKERKETDKCIKIISKEGKLFQSYKAAVLFMRSTNLYTTEDIESFYFFPDAQFLLFTRCPVFTFLPCSCYSAALLPMYL